MRSTPGVLHAKCGELELHLEPLPPPSPVVVPEPSPADDLDDERRSLETLLYSAGVDVEPFMRAARGKKAA